MGVEREEGGVKDDVMEGERDEVELHASSMICSHLMFTSYQRMYPDWVKALAVTVGLCRCLATAASH